MIEYLTDQICTRVMEYIEKIDAMGGALAAIDKGYMQNEIMESAYRYPKEIEAKKQIVVGVNAFQVDEQLELDALAVDPAIEIEQRQRLAELRASRDSAKVAELMGQLEQSARGSDNLMPLFITCLENDLTLGEICGVLRRVWGEYHPPAWI